MFKRQKVPQLSIYDFITPFGGHLNGENRWVITAEKMDWDYIDEVYEKAFKNKETGNVAYSSRIAFGSLYIQKKLGLTDEETVEMIQENPYLQYFIGYKEYTYEKPFDSSTLVYFRKRLPQEVMNEINEHHFKDKAGGSGSNAGTSNETEISSESSEKQNNSGTLIIDATCTPADIAYPTDLELCSKSREWTEDIFDYLYTTQGNFSGTNTKPRTYREVARHRFLLLNKRSKKTAKKIRKELRYQLNCIYRNLCYIMHYDLSKLPKIMVQRYFTIWEVYRQQKEMLDEKKHYVKDRIVNLAQPWIRPIVRGKAKAKTEFGAKISISVVNGYTFLDRMSFDAYNEGDPEEFIQTVELYRKRFGCYPERILADKIYRSRKNKAYCKRHGIRMSGPKLGRPKEDNQEEIKQELREIGERNEVEGKFGTGKRRYGLGLIKAKLQETTQADIGMNLFVENMEHQIREDLKSFSLALFHKCYCTLENLMYVLTSGYEMGIIQ